jgi:hypothetical protein
MVAGAPVPLSSDREIVIAFECQRDGVSRARIPDVAESLQAGNSQDQIWGAQRAAERIDSGLLANFAKVGRRGDAKLCASVIKDRKESPDIACVTRSLDVGVGWLNRHGRRR